MAAEYLHFKERDRDAAHVMEEQPGTASQKANVAFGAFCLFAVWINDRNSSQSEVKTQEVIEDTANRWTESLQYRLNLRHGGDGDR